MSEHSGCGIGQAADTLTVQRTVVFGDCDPAGIVYTPRIFDYCLEAIEAFWKTILDGVGWYELTMDHDRGAPFVNVNMNFISPITPREILDITVRLAEVGRSSVTFDVSGAQSGRACFPGTFTSVIVQKASLSKVDESDWTMAAARAVIKD